MTSNIFPIDPFQEHLKDLVKKTKAVGIIASLVYENSTIQSGYYTSKPIDASFIFEALCHLNAHLYDSLQDEKNE